jgi:uncharacterized protein
MHVSSKLLPKVAPVREFVVKVAARCNLNCDYCYEYRHGDNSWRDLSKFITQDVYEEAARKIAAHAKAHGLNSVSISLHGGEPLLLGEKRLMRIASTFRKAIEAEGACVYLGMQSNGVLLTDKLAQVIRDNDIYVGFSVDGGATANDRHRLDFRGQSTYSRVLAGIETLRRISPEHASGLLAVIDIDNDPIETFDVLASFGLSNIDFLLPHYNWDRLPPKQENVESPYGKWLGEIWQAWVAGRHSDIRIRFLDNIVARLVGHPGIYEQMSDAPVQLITINTDGEFEGVDTLKSTGSGIQRTGLNIMQHDIDDLLSHPLYIFRQDWQTTLPIACTDCSIKTICTGGYIPHRFKAGSGFNNPSVYCHDIQFIVKRIKNSLEQYLGKSA